MQCPTSDCGAGETSVGTNRAEWLDACALRRLRVGSTPRGYFQYPDQTILAVQRRPRQRPIELGPFDQVRTIAQQPPKTEPGREALFPIRRSRLTDDLAPGNALVSGSGVR